MILKLIYMVYDRNLVRGIAMSKRAWVRCTLTIISLILFSYNQTSLAKPLLIQITGGKNLGVPIAIADFAGNKQGWQDIEDIAQVIRNDLHNSGQFRVLQAEQMPGHPTEVGNVDAQVWRNADVENLVLGTIEKSGSDNYTVTFHILDLYSSNQLPALSLRFSHKSKRELRALAHQISDRIFEKIIGVKGFFSTRIAYITVDYKSKETVHTLTVADADGFNDKPLVNTNYPLMSPAWSPDGKEIAYVSFAGNRSAVNVVNVTTGKVRNITSYAGINSAPAWSPDGKTLAVVLSKGGSPNIYLVDLETKQMRQLTKGNFIDTEPFWDKGGESIVFTSNRGGKPQIYRVTLTTGKVERLTFKGDYNATPSLTPDGKMLVMLHRDETGFHIAVQSLATGNVKTLTRAKLDESPTIAPNGMMILYGTIEGKNSVLGAVSLDGRFRMRLPVQDSNVKEPVWSPYLI